MMDGKQPIVGDNVYVLGMGHGHIVRVNEDYGFSVKTGQGVSNYSPGGVVGRGKRMVFWDNPILVIPSSDKRLWREYVKATTLLYKTMESLFRNGHIPEIEYEENINLG